MFCIGVRFRLPHWGGGGVHKPRVLDSRVLRKIFGLRRDEVRVEWRRLHKQELYDHYSTPNSIRVMNSRRWAGHVARMGDRRVTDRVLVGRPDWRRQLGKHRCRWKGNIKMCIQEVGWGYMDLIAAAQDRWWALVNAVMNIRVP